MTPQTITITTARGETFTMNFDGPVTVAVTDVPLSPFEVGDVMPTQSTAPKFKVGDVVYWETESGSKYPVMILTVYAHQVRAEVLEPYASCHKYKPGYIVYCSKDDLHHDYRTVAGGGWRKCVCSKIYKSRDGLVTKWESGSYNLGGYSIVDTRYDLIEELP